MMDRDTEQFNAARALESRLVGFEKFMNDLTGSLQLLRIEVSTLEEQLSGLNSEIDNYQREMNKLKRDNPNVERAVDAVSEQTKAYHLMNAHLNSLQKRKTNIFENRFELEAEELENKLNKVWTSFNDKNSELDEMIKKTELKRAEQQGMVSKKYGLEIDKYKKAIDKLREENGILANKLNIISRT